MIKMLVMDVDGTMTDGKIYMGDNGEVMKAFDIQDGYGIAHILPDIGVVPVIITGRRSQIVENRANELGIHELYQGVSNKAVQLKTIAEEHDLKLEEVAYIGDDLNDLGCMQLCGLSACPQNAVNEIKETVDYVCSHMGGHGAVREFIGYIQSQIVNIIKKK